MITHLISSNSSFPTVLSLNSFQKKYTYMHIITFIMNLILFFSYIV
jgi:hypothetical protein